MEALVPLALMLGLMWLLLIRPQKRQAQRRYRFLSALETGQQVIGGGLVGRVVAVREADVDLEVAPGTVVRVVKGALHELPAAALDTAGGTAATPNDETDL